jgi:hypothetical protein
LRVTFWGAPTVCGVWTYSIFTLLTVAVFRSAMRTVDPYSNEPDAARVPP